MKFIDTNTWCGTWPFSPVCPSHARPPRIRRVGYEVSVALVSPFEAVFQADPMPGNRANFEALRNSRRHRPLPIINPATPAWEAHLEEVAIHKQVTAVRLLPSYHGYTLRSASVRKLTQRLQQLRIRMVITARLVDERQEYHSLTIKPLPVAQLLRFIEAYPDTHPLIQGLGVHELKELSQATGKFSADTSFAEWEDTLRVLKERIPIARIQFGSLSPLQVVQAQVDKVRLSSLSKSQRESVAHSNARKYFRI